VPGVAIFIVLVVVVIVGLMLAGDRPTSR